MKSSEWKIVQRPNKILNDRLGQLVHKIGNWGQFSKARFTDVYSMVGHYEHLLW